MAHVFKTLKWTAFLSGSAAAVVTNATGHITYITSIILHNTDTVDRIVSIWLVQNSTGSVGTAADGNRIFKLTLSANQTVLLTFSGAESLSLDANNDTLQADADAANKVTIAIKGDDLT